MTDSRTFLTRDQQRAQHALGKVQEVSGERAPEYLALVKSFPATIVMNGLGQACAMLLAKAEGNEAGASAHRCLYDHLAEWILNHTGIYPAQTDGRQGKKQTDSQTGKLELIEAVISHGQSHYVRAQAEALAYVDWLKKFAQAELKEKGA